MSLLDATHLSLWGSGTRIYANYKWRFFGEQNFADGGRAAIPPDVAQVIDELKRREKSSFAEVISSLRPIDAELTDRYRSQMSIPAGGSIFGPIYAQYLALEGAPEMAEREELIWNAMPIEWYLLNRYEGRLSDEQAAILQELYGGVTERAKAGLTPFVPDDTAAKRAIEVRKLIYSAGLGPDIFSKGVEGAILGIPRVIWGIGAFVGIIVVGVVAVGVVKSMEMAPIIETLQATLQDNANRYKLDQQIAENNKPIIDYCVQHAMANGLPPDNCARMSQSLTPWVAPTDPGRAAAQVAGLIQCEADGCWTWIAVGGVLGALAGLVAAHRLIGR